MTTTNAIKSPPHQNIDGDQLIDLMVGRIKPKPICVDVNLKQEAMSYEELNKFVFPILESPGYAGTCTSIGTAAGAGKISPQETSVVSSNSSTASRESGSSVSTSCGVGGVLQRKDESERINGKVKNHTSSRNGRQTQRWYTDPTTQRLYRMTTGCVPIVGDGKILFVSASRKSEWILPKGGWEKDEDIEESAIRETFEEAGVFGILGPALKEVIYETRKGKKRRIEYEEIQRKAKQIRVRTLSPKGISPTVQEQVTFPSGDDPRTKDDVPTTRTKHRQANNPQHYFNEDSSSVASETSPSYTHVKMSLFPLYVTEVRDEWPEHGRLRKVVDIDEAINMTESRPEFQEALLELKQRNLHKVQKSTTINSTPMTGCSSKR